MAERVVRERVDDLERERGHFVQADERLTFSLDGKSFVIDLSAANAAVLREALRPFVEHAQPLINYHDYDGMTEPQLKRAELNRVREWAREQGLTPNERGRIAESIIKQYEQVHGPLRHRRRSRPV
jgi:hypothetical protein